MNYLDLDSLNIPNDIKKILKEFIAKAKQTLGEDVKIYLFGSYAKGTWLRDSDLDLIVVSNRFNGLKIHERYVLVRNLLPPEISVDLLLYTPDEFDIVRRRSIILQDALEYAIELT